MSETNRSRSYFDRYGDIFGDLRGVPGRAFKQIVEPIGPRLKRRGHLHGAAIRIGDNAPLIRNSIPVDSGATSGVSGSVG